MAQPPGTPPGRLGSRPLPKESLEGLYMRFFVIFVRAKASNV